MNNGSGLSELFKKLTEKRNTIFLIMCLIVHFSYFMSFLTFEVIPLMILNIISVLFYIFFIVCAKDKEKTESVIVAAYFEIIGFSMISEIFTRGTYGFIYFVLGMIPVIFYLTPTYKNKRFIFQVTGIIAAVLIHHIDFIIPKDFFAETFEKTQGHAGIFKFVNLVITLGTIMYTSFFYEMELDMLKSELDYNSTHDTLTGLYNRRFLYDMIKESKDESITVALFDIDNFKKINDRFGHDIGDDTLVTVSSCLKEFSENVNTVPVRWGGEEFVMYCRNTDIESAYARISELCAKISEKAVLPDEAHVTVTAGLVHGSKNDFEKVIKKADDYLYIGKQNGKNCIIWHQNEHQYKQN